MSLKYSVVLLAAVLIVPAAGAQISPDARLFQNPERDGAVFTGMYLDGQFRYQQWNRGGFQSDFWMLGPTFAASFPALPQLETGGRVWLVHSDPSGLSSETRFSDIDLWGKFQFIDDPILLSAGLLFTLPTGNKKLFHPVATNKVNLELFGAGRYYFSEVLALVGHLGFRFNANAKWQYRTAREEIVIDPDAEEVPIETRKVKVEEKLDGRVQFLMGAGIIYYASPVIDIICQLDFASQAYRGLKQDVKLTGGLAYWFGQDFSGRIGLGMGFDEGSPASELILGASAFF